MNVTSRIARISAMIVAVLIGATLFTLLFRGLGGETLIREVLAALPGGLTGAMLFTMVLRFVPGFFLDFLEIILVLVRILCPALIIIAADPVWLGGVIRAIAFGPSLRPSL